MTDTTTPPPGPQFTPGGIKIDRPRETYRPNAPRAVPPPSRDHTGSMIHMLRQAGVAEGEIAAAAARDARPMPQPEPKSPAQQQHDQEYGVNSNPSAYTLDALPRAYGDPAAARAFDADARNFLTEIGIDRHTGQGLVRDMIEETRKFDALPADERAAFKAKAQETIRRLYGNDLQRVAENLDKLVVGKQDSQFLKMLVENAGRNPFVFARLVAVSEHLQRWAAGRPK